MVQTEEAARYAPGVIYVKPSIGNDANPGTQALPIATLANALRTKLPSMVIIDEPCTLEATDVRNTDAPNAQAGYPTGIIKHIRTTYPVTITVAGANLAAVTWTANGTYADVWDATLPTLATGQALHRLMRTDQVDEEGFPKELIKAATLATVNTATTGWFFTPATKVLSVKLGAGLSVDASKAALKANWTNFAATARILALGADLVLEGPITLDGVQPWGIVGGGRAPRIWLKSTTILRSPSYGVSCEQGSSYSQDCRIHSSWYDGINNFTGPAAPVHGIQMDINCLITGSGRQIYGTATQNGQAVSAHGGQHRISYGSTYRGSWGQDTADTSVVGYDSVSWLVGCVSQGAATPTKTAFSSSGVAGGTRKMWLDTCQATGCTVGIEINIAAQTQVKTYASAITGTTVGGTVLSYTPDAP
jgi:hypothetical protein